LIKINYKRLVLVLNNQMKKTENKTNASLRVLEHASVSDYRKACQIEDNFVFFCILELALKQTYSLQQITTFCLMLGKSSFYIITYLTTISISITYWVEVVFYFAKQCQFILIMTSFIFFLTTSMHTLCLTFLHDVFSIFFLTALISYV